MKLNILILSFFLSAASGVTELYSQDEPQTAPSQIIKTEEHISADTILRDTLKLYSNFKSYSDTTEISMSLVSFNMENKVSYNYDISILKPNKISILSHSDTYGKTMVSDGIDMWIHMPFMAKHTRTSAPAGLDHIFNVDISDIEGMGTEQFLLYLFFNEGKGFLSSDKLKSSIYGEELVNGKVSYIIDLKQDPLLIRLWIDKDSSYINKIMLDATSLIEKQQQQIGIDNPQMNMEYIEIHSNITVDTELDENVFKFRVPEDSEIVDDFYDEQVPSHEYLNLEKKFIDFELRSLTKKDRIKLSQYYGDIIILSFMDITQEKSQYLISDLKNISFKYKNSPVSVIAIDSTNNEKLLKKTIKGKKIRFPLLIEEDSGISNIYGASSFPSLYIIDENGTIKHIYSDYFMGLKERIQQDIGLLLAAMEKPYIDPQKEDPTRGLHKLWHLPVKTTSLSSDDLLISISAQSEMYLISDKGNIINIIKLKHRINTINSIDMENDGIKEYIGYWKNHTDIIAFDNSGKLIWKNKIMPGITDIKTGDISSDERPEIVVGLNGFEGVKTLDHDGQQIWSSTDIINSSKLDIGDINNNGSKEIAALSGDFSVHILDNSGKAIKILEPEIQPNFLRAVKNSDNDTDLLISGSSYDNEILKLVDWNGRVIWETILGNIQSSRVEDIKVHPQKDIIAVSTADGQVFVFDKIGNIMAYLDENSSNILIEWLITDTGETNLVTAGIENGITNYLLIESE